MLLENGIVPWSQRYTDELSTKLEEAFKHPGVAALKCEFQEPLDFLRTAVSKAAEG
jgi:hypothetical protein